MRIALIIIIGLHGLIHLLGFVKAFELIELKTLSQTISKPIGIIWLAAFGLFAITAILFTCKNNYWYFFGIISVVVSQILIISFWKETKFGTIANLVILFTSIIAYATLNFSKMVNTEISQILSTVELNKSSIVSREMVANLPLPVQKWLEKTGIIGNTIIKSVYLKQQVLMKMKPGQKDWYEAEAEQYFTTRTPAFNWTVNLQMNPIIKVIGRDKFENGKGEMLIKVLSLFPVVDARKNEKVNEGTLQRYLAEIVWFPSAALSPYISWEEIDSHSARAIMIYKGTKGSGIFYFDDNGLFREFRAMRYKGSDEDSELKEWVIEVSESKVMNGIRIPVEMKATWKLDNDDWTWLKLKVTEIQYNIEKMPVTNTR